jgi:hypothetical protein
VAKFGIALGSGPRGPGFESRRSDQPKAEHIGAKNPQIIEKSVVCGSFSAFLRLNKIPKKCGFCTLSDTILIANLEHEKAVETCSAALFFSMPRSLVECALCKPLP